MSNNLQPAAGSGSAYPQYSGNLPGSFSNSAYDSPSMTGYGYGYYGGMAPIPEGGYYNQMSQMMAGPSYAPVGSTWETMAPGQSWNSPAEGYGGGYGGMSSGGKGMTSGGKGLGSGLGSFTQSPTGSSGLGSNGVQQGLGGFGGMANPGPFNPSLQFPIADQGFNPYRQFPIADQGSGGYTSAPSAGQSLSQLGTGLYGQPTAPTTTTTNTAPVHQGGGFGGYGGAPSYQLPGQNQWGLHPNVPIGRMPL